MRLQQSSLSTLFFLLSFFEISYCTKAEPIPIFIYNNSQSYLLQLFFGIQREPSTLPIDISSQATWIYSNDINTFISESQARILKSSTQFSLRNQETFYGKAVKGPSTLVNNNFNLTIPELNYYVIYTNSSNTNRQGALSFPSKYFIQDYSLIHQYYKKGIIDNLSFSLVINQTHKFLYLGGIPADAIFNKTKSEFKVYGLTHLWDFTISSIRITIFEQEYLYSSKKTINGNYAYLDTIEKYILAPKEFMDFLFEIVFKKEIDNKSCYVSTYDNHRQLFCYYEWLRLSGNILFNINGYEYNFILYHFWVCFEEFCFFRIIENNYNDDWVLGNIFLWGINILFDYENNKVQLFTDKGVIVKKLIIENKKDRFELYSVKVSCLLLVLGTLVLIIAKVKIIN